MYLIQRESQHVFDSEEVPGFCLILRESQHVSGSVGGAECIRF